VGSDFKAFFKGKKGKSGQEEVKGTLKEDLSKKRSTVKLEKKKDKPSPLKDDQDLVKQGVSLTPKESKKDFEERLKERKKSES